MAAGSCDEVYGIWVRQVEREVAEILCHSVSGSSQVAARAEGPQFVTKPALGAPKVSKVTLAWRVLAGWLREVLQGMGSTNLGVQQRAKRASWRVLHHRWEFREVTKHTNAFLCWARAINAE
eukprot:4365461-Karenia_brevis.AAC.1